MLNRLFTRLDNVEHQQLVDYIITVYNCIDHAAASHYFGGYKNMVIAVNTAKGGEYEMKEEFTGNSDIVYSKMSKYLLENRLMGNVDELLLLDVVRREALKKRLVCNTDATLRQAAKYLHLPANG